ncbi:MAG: ABC transporter permease [Dehalococcoidia bacterium]|nr:MAG: ABC transporter permease [Dehalococcoidia bacterium]
MTGYFIRRLLWIIPVLWLISLITFALMHAVKGGPFEQGDSKSSSAGRAALMAKYHLDEPVWVQYGYYMRDLLQGDLGPDLASQGTSVNDIFKHNWRPTVELGVATTIYAVVVGVSLGILAASRRNSIIDYASIGFATVGAAAPNFVLGIMLVLLFAVKWKFFPAIGWGGLTGWRYMVLPVISLGSLPAAFLARLTRASMLEVMHQDYIRTAYAKGLMGRVVTLRHVARNALIPVLTAIGPIAASLLTGSFVIEYFFSIPGIGRSYVQAILGRDYPLIMATTLLYALVIVIANLVIDMLYAVVDPRIRYS